MKLGEIRWPIFRLKTAEPELEDGRLVYKNEYLSLDDMNRYVNTVTVDYPSCGKLTLGERRLAATKVGDKLYPLKRAVFTISDLLKSNPRFYWIDSDGKIFKHKKTTMYELSFYKIKSIIRGNSVGCVVELQGLPIRFYTSLRLKDNITYWAGVLHKNGKYILYGIFDKEYAPSRRKV